MTNRVRGTRTALLAAGLAGMLACGAQSGGSTAPAMETSTSDRARETTRGAASPSADTPPHWGYEAEDGPARWSAMYADWAVCGAGRAQSPIDLSAAAPRDLPPVHIRTPSDAEVEVLNQAGVVEELDNGHTIQINARTGESVTVGDKRYDLVQLHFHAPSEHTIDGEQFPMEIHFVHEADDGTLAVVGLLVEEGEANRGIEVFWALLDRAIGSRTVVEVPPHFVDELFGERHPGLFYYTGSLTTPPCTEGVRWFVRQVPVTFSAEQIAAFTAVYDHNNRPVQSRHGRSVYFDADPELTAE